MISDNDVDAIAFRCILIKLYKNEESIQSREQGNNFYRQTKSELGGNIQLLIMYGGIPTSEIIISN
jgi:hypothetical protein